MHCVVKDCQSIKRGNENKNSRIILHSFPKDEILRNKWLLILGIREEDFCKNWKVCSLHFSDYHYKNPQSTARRILKDFAFPTQKLNINFNNNLYDIKNRDDVIIPTSGIEFQNDIVELNLDEKSQEHFNLHRKPLQSKPQILSIFPISNSSNEVQYISEIMPEVSISNNFLQNIQEKPKILSVVEITTSNVFEVTSPKETSYAINYPISPRPPEGTSTGENKSILKKKVLSDFDAKKMILKNKDLRNKLKEREHKIQALNKKVFRKRDKIIYMENTLAEMKKQFGIIKC